MCFVCCRMLPEILNIPDIRHMVFCRTNCLTYCDTTLPRRTPEVLFYISMLLSTVHRCSRNWITVTWSSQGFQWQHWCHCNMYYMLLLDLYWKYAHMTPTLRDLHLLLIPQRIKFKLCVLVHKTSWPFAKLPVWSVDSRCLRTWKTVASQVRP